MGSKPEPKTAVTEPMERSPLVSIITPSLNQGKYIEETILSVLAQDYENVEYIVIDGGSTDGTLDILRKYDGRLTWRSEPDNGQSHAVNKGLRLARGSIIGWLNSDDTYTENAVGEAVSFLKANPRHAMVYGEADIVNERGKRIGAYETEPFDLERLSKHCPICQPSAFIRAEVLAEAGGLDERLHYCMDMDLWIRIGRKYEVGYIEKPLAKSRWHAASKTFGQRKAALIEAMKVVRYHYGYVPRARIRAYAEYTLDAAFGKRLRANSLIFKNMKKLSTGLNFIRYNYGQEQYLDPSRTRTRSDTSST